MRWVHDLDAFHRLSIREQEAVIGRTRPDSVELSAARSRPPHTSRGSRSTQAARGLEIFRRSVPYGTVEEHGLYFVAFSADPSRYGEMLARMLGTAPDGVRDRLTESSGPWAAPTTSRHR